MTLPEILPIYCVSYWNFFQKNSRLLFWASCEWGGHDFKIIASLQNNKLYEIEFFNLSNITKLYWVSKNVKESRKADHTRENINFRGIDWLLTIIFFTWKCSTFLALIFGLIIVYGFMFSKNTRRYRIIPQTKILVCLALFADEKWTFQFSSHLGICAGIICSIKAKFINRLAFTYSLSLKYFQPKPIDYVTW